MTLKEKIEADLATALKENKALERSVLLLLKATLHNQEIAQRGPLSESEIQAVIRAEIKRREEAMAAYRQAGETARAQREEAEKAILLDYLPPPLAEAILNQKVEAAIKQTGAQSLVDLGKVMAVLMKEEALRPESQRLAQMVKAKLSLEQAQ